jgi:hypothetical protein
MSERGPLVKIGALWSKRDKNNQMYLTGKLGDAQLLVFPNGYKENEKQPDYLCYVAAGKPETRQKSLVEEVPENPTMQDGPAGSSGYAADAVPPLTDDDIPF